MAKLSSSTNPLVGVLAVLFGIGAWVSVNGLWVELPLLVSLPEGWALPSYLSIIIQIANIGPIMYSVARVLRPTIKPAPVIYAVVTIGCVSSLLLIFFWDVTSVVFGELHSTGLLTLVFFLALVDCTSSVLYLPYMGLWKNPYLPLYSMGEGLSGFLPAVIALAQGVDNTDGSYNNSTNASTTEGFEVASNSNSGLNFSVDVFFLCIFIMMVMSAIAFVLLDLLPIIQHERDKTYLNRKHSQRTDFDSTISTVANNKGTQNPAYASENVESSPATHAGDGSSILPEVNFEWPRTTLTTLILVQMFVCLITNGFLPSIQSYSCLPYGQMAYHLAVTLSAFANPMAALSTAFMGRAKLSTIAVLTVVGSIVAGFIIATAVMSPDPPLAGTSGGTALVVLSWVVYMYVLSYVKVEINNMLRLTEGNKGNRVLFWSGAATQAGSFIGALVAFILVNVVVVFHSY